MYFNRLYFRILKVFPSELFFLTIAGFFTRFFNLVSNQIVIFDEAHFGLYATKYISHQYFFDIHPPLGKMLIALSVWIGGVKPGFDFPINVSYGDFPIIAVRFFPAFFGALLIPLIYFLMKELNFSRKVAFLAGFFVLFDNALLIQSRLALLDIIMLFFIFFSLLLFLISIKKKKYSQNWYLTSLICGVFLGFAISVKWIGIGAIAIIWIYQIYIGDWLTGKYRKNILCSILFFIIIPLSVYISIFSIHLILLNKACDINCGQVLSEGHFLNKTNFIGFNTPPTGNFVQKLFNENEKMAFSTFLGTSGAHFFQSDWYSWPSMTRPIQYARLNQGEEIKYLYFIGNPLVWWLSFLGVLGIFYILFRNYFYKKLKFTPLEFLSNGMGFLIIGYICFFLFFSIILRFMFLYHYLTALVFSIMIFSVFINGMLSKISSKNAKIIYIFILILIFGSFLFFSPLTYGLPLTEGEYQMRMWLPIWKY
ncbi:MAG: phospholipid carrier-dependent glycosyltransferase [Candidatus Parcubacteria bacterium]|nr:phospholipid carrier-dependent glycosyltransferase [Candidatus Parcubacteria bacterium]